MKTKDVLKWMAMFLAIGLLAGCESESDNDDNEGPDEILITQSQLNNATDMIGDFTGGTFAHGGPSGTTGDETIREVYASLASLSETVAPGTIVTKNTFAREPDGSTGDLYVSFVMVKRESGFDTTNKDWEFMQIPFDASNDYGINPFGMLPAVGAGNRGSLAGCIGCHSGAGGGDYLFVND
ncbi:MULTISPECIES: hypothetical protein [unclassified Saccharicrinis]|uniref:hypothetical protein n=1 Tax=unclassified Saccharicrinis TaxID=2646859 RepID=UPI003D325DB8